MNKLRLIFGCAIFMALISCGGNDEPKPVDVTTVISSKSFNYVNVSGQNGGKAMAGARCVVAFDNISKTAVVEFENVRLADADAPVSYRIVDVPWTMDAQRNVRSISVKSVRTTGSSPVQINDLNIVYCNEMKEFDGVKCQSLAVEYGVEGKVAVTMIPCLMMFDGTTETLNTMTTKKFVTTKTSYTVSLDVDKMAADVTVANASFDPNMPAMRDMLFANIPLTLVDGGFKLNSELFTPSIGGVPYPNYAISDFAVDSDLASGTKLTFRCMKVFSVEAILSSAYSPVD